MRPFLAVIVALLFGCGPPLYPSPHANREHHRWSSPGKPQPDRGDSQASGNAVLFSEKEVEIIGTLSPLGPPPPDASNKYADHADAAELGRLLFFDNRLSGDRTISCASCHDPDRGWSDGHRVARGLGPTSRHTPTLWNVAYNRWFFWDGRSDSLWSQVLGPLENPNEQGGSRLQLAHLLHDDPSLRAAYSQAFGTPPDLSDHRRFPATGRPVAEDPSHPHQVAWARMSYADKTLVNTMTANACKAIAAFERRIVSHRSKFDLFVEGLRENNPEKLEVISDSAKRGLRLFIGKANCRLCHSGPALSDGEFHNIRVPPMDGDSYVDSGRYAGIDKVKADPFNSLGPYCDDRTETGREKLAYLVVHSDNWGQFKTPSLRNVEFTSPYMHQGQFGSLREVVTYYSTLKGAAEAGHHDEQILSPLNLAEAEIDDLVAFLLTLSDDTKLKELRR